MRIKCATLYPSACVEKEKIAVGPCGMCRVIVEMCHPADNLLNRLYHSRYICAATYVFPNQHVKGQEMGLIMQGWTDPSPVWDMANSWQIYKILDNL